MRGNLEIIKYTSVSLSRCFITVSHSYREYPFLNKSRTQAGVYTLDVTRRQCGMFSRDVGYMCVACYWGCCWSNKSASSAARFLRNAKFVAVVFVYDRPTDCLGTKKATVCMHTRIWLCGKQKYIMPDRRWWIAAWLTWIFRDFWITYQRNSGEFLL